jgi:sulfur relay protein TusC/DsrF
MKKVVFLIRTAPYGMAAAGEGFRAIIAAAGMEIKTAAAFVEDGVFVAKTNQHPEKIGMSKLEAAYKQIPDFGAQLYIHRESAKERGLREAETIPAHWISTEELKNIINSADAVISFA